MRLFHYLLLGVVLTACSQEPATPEHPDQGSGVENGRITEAYDRLNSDSAGSRVLRAIEAHGGLEAWYENSPLYFHFNYQPLDDGSPRNTYAWNDYVNSRAVHALVTDTTQRFGFDGTEAWSITGERIAGMSPRFWSLTPYYFVGLPFVLADEGIRFENLPEKEMDGVAYNLVKVTFTAGTGDAPDDYYVLYLHPETGQLDALRYIVSYPGYFPDGGHNPEKLMKITGKTKVDGITLPTGYATYWWNEGETDEVITDITVSDYRFQTNLPEDFFDRPAGARVFSDLPE